MGVSQALLIHSGTAAGSDLFKAVITMLDPAVALSVVSLPAAKPANGESNWIERDMERAEQLHRPVEVLALPAGDPARAIVQLAGKERFNLVILGVAAESDPSEPSPVDVDYVLDHAPCWVCLVTSTVIPQELEEERPPAPSEGSST